MRNLEGQKAVVFGAGSKEGTISIGRAIAEELARGGATVLAVDKNFASAKVTAQSILGTGGVARAVAADVTDQNSINVAVSDFAAEFGTPSISIYNVGIQTLGKVEDLSADAWNATMATNLNGAFYTVQTMLPFLRSNGGGSFVFVSSIASILTSKTANIAYGTSKAALNLFARSIAVSHAKEGIRSNLVLPGLIDTPMIRSAFSEDPDVVEQIMAERSNRCPSGRMGRAEEVAKAVAFLASNDASYVSGAAIPVDGALSSLMA